MKGTFYFPKGGMCRACVHVESIECYKLPFSTMRIMEKVPMGEKGTGMIVKCTEFKREEKQNE